MALRALEIDPSLGEAHTSLAWSAFTYDFDWAEADRKFQQAIQFSPGYATAHHWYGVFLSAMGDIDRARAEMAQALELDPFSPVIHAQVAFPDFSSGEMEKAIDTYRRALAKFPGFQIAVTGVCRCLVAIGAYEEAIAECQLAEPVGKDGLLGMAYGFSGRTMEAQAALQNLDRMSRDGWVPAANYVYVYIGLGDKERALDWLERGYDERGIFAAWLKTWPLYDPLRGEPRFKALLARMRFPEGPS
jgi:serine/threonine-protein kinase